MKNFFVLFIYLICFHSLHAQKATIYGTVSDSLNHPLFGVTVAVFGRPIGTITDEAGKYSLQVPPNESLKIYFSFAGLQPDSQTIILSPGEQRQISRRLLQRIIEMQGVT